MDRLCTLLVVANLNYHRATPTLHEISLPRSWLVRLLAVFNKLPPQSDSSISMIRLYVRAVGAMLEQIYTRVHAGKWASILNRDNPFDFYAVRSSFV